MKLPGASEGGGIRCESVFGLMRFGKVNPLY